MTGIGACVTGVLAATAISYQYDSLHRRTNLAIHTPGSTINHAYTYDSGSRLSTVSDGTYNAAYDYLANSPLVSQITYRSNSAVRMTTTKKYDFLNRLVDITSAPSASSAVKFSYAYNDANQRVRRTDSDDSYWAYEYDGLGDALSTTFDFLVDGVIKTVGVTALGYHEPDVPDQEMRARLETLARELDQFDALVQSGEVESLGAYNPQAYRVTLGSPLEPELPGEPWPWSDLQLSDFDAPEGNPPRLVVTADQAAHAASGVKKTSAWMSPRASPRRSMTLVAASIIGGGPARYAFHPARSRRSAATASLTSPVRCGVGPPGSESTGMKDRLGWRDARPRKCSTRYRSRSARTPK